MTWFTRSDNLRRLGDAGPFGRMRRPFPHFLSDSDISSNATGHHCGVYFHSLPKFVMPRNLRAAIRFVLATISTFAVMSASASAQGTIAGTWSLRYERHTQQHSAATAQVQVIEGRLTLRLSGDSLFGEWQRVVVRGDTAPPPQNVHGARRGDSVFLRLAPTTDSEAGFLARAAHEAAVFVRTYVHGMPPTTTAFDLSWRGDALAGVRRTVLLDGTPRGGESAVTGVRAKP